MARAVLTDQQIEVLAELAGCDRLEYGGRNFALPGGGTARMYQPMAFGGHNGSHHSGTATALAKRGLVDRLKIATFGLDVEFNNFRSRQKGSCHYRITEAGREALAQARAAADSPQEASDA